ncbi:MAG: histidine kinase dimerization/phosphoacceptor domain -containing protein [Nitrospirota bacterium]
MSTRKIDIIEEQNLKLREIIDYQRKTLDSLFDISKALSSTTNFDAILKQVVERILPVLNAQSGIVWLLEQNTLKRCWEIFGCKEIGCQAYQNTDIKCWSVSNPHCCGTSRDGLESKIRKCINCQVFKGGILETAITIGMTPEIIEPHVLIIGEGLCNDVIMRYPEISVFHIFPAEDGIKSYRQAEWVSDKTLDRNPELIPEKYCFLETSISNPKTRIGIALMTQKQLIGIMCIALDRVHYLTDSEANLLINIARITAISIENAELYCTAEKRYQQIRTVLKEAHHRIKNNLQTIAGLFYMQLDKNQDKNIQGLLLDNLTRVKSISMVHQLLSQEDLKDVKLSSLIEKIIEMIINVTNSKERISFEVLGDEVEIPSRRATSLAIVINELTTNSIKHGIDYSGKIEVRITKENNQTHMEFYDNGKGLPQNFPKNLGLQIVSTLIEEDLEGTFELSSQNGTLARISFRG